MTRLRRHWPAVSLSALACLMLSGCALGSSPSAGTASRHVTVTLTAPTSGATVGVRQIEVFGSVKPADAAVRVDGLPAGVSHGSFSRALVLSRPTTAISVTAGAAGYTPTTVRVTVSFSSTLAASLVAARQAQLVAAKPAAGRSVPAGIAAPVTVKAAPRGFIPLVSLGTAPGSSGSAGSSGTSGTSGSSGSSGSSSPSGGSTSASAPSPATTPQPTPAMLLTADIHRLYVKGCSQGSGGRSAMSYCNCMYRHLRRSGALTSRRGVRVLERGIKRFHRTQDLFALPTYLVEAQVNCVARLPTPKLGITNLPQLHYPPRRAPNGF